MKKIIITQTNRQSFKKVKKSVKRNFPKLFNNIVFNNEFESTLSLIPKDGEVVVITSNHFHDKENKLFTKIEKNGNRLAELIKEINPKAKVCVFSLNSPFPNNDSIDMFFQKDFEGCNVGNEIVEVICKLGLAEKPKIGKIKHLIHSFKKFFDF